MRIVVRLIVMDKFSHREDILRESSGVNLNPIDAMKQMADDNLSDYAKR